MNLQLLFDSLTSYKKSIILLMVLFFAYALAFGQDESLSFKEGFAKITSKGKFGFIDKKGNIQVPCTFDFVNDFENGYSVVRIEKKYGIIRKDGSLLVDLKYDLCESFSDGMALVRMGNKYLR
jgi:hypothetical protein